MKENNFKIEKIVTKYYTNTYFVFTDTDVIVVDPGGNTDKILEFIKENGNLPIAVLVTHGHFDHTLSAAEILKNGGRAYMSLKDDFLITDGGHMKSRGVFIEKFDYTDVADGDIINIGGMEFKVLATPGHSPGSVCYVLNNYIFSGDTLFCGSIGRTDLWGGDAGAQAESLKKLAALPDEFIVLSGHGQQTTIGKEKRENPYLINCKV